MPAYHDTDALGRMGPGEDIIPITPDDANDLANGPCRAIRCTTVGHFVGVTVSGNTRTVTMYQQGEVLNNSFKRILATGTTGAYEAIY